MKTSHIRLITAIICGFLLVSCDQLKVENAPAATQLDGETAAIVNEEPIYIIDVELEAVAQGLIAPGDPFGKTNEQYQNVLDQLIDQRLLAQEAIARNLDFDEAARHRLAIARERILGNLLIESLVASEVTEETIRAMFDEQSRLQQLDDEVRISLITVPDQAQANAAITEYKNGIDFSALAFKYSTDTRTRIEGGDLGYISPADQPEPFSSIIANTAVGEISEAFKSKETWHVLKVEDRRQRPPLTLEEMRSEIVTFMTFSEINKILRQLRIDADIKAPVLPDAKETDVPQPTSKPPTPTTDISSAATPPTQEDQ
jgi:peptidyl-prolyl cis-trans isomerase C